MRLKNQIYSALPTSIYLRLRWAAYRRARRDSFPYRQADRRRETSSGYSLKPFDDTRSLFVHVPKCAGVSVCRALYGNLAGGHTTLAEYIDIFEPACIENYFKFTIVRNPRDRLVSAYHFLKGGGFSAKDKAWFDRELGRFRDFRDFVHGWVNSDNIWTYHHFRPQHHYLLDQHAQVPLDFFCLMETLDEDFAFIKEKIGLGPTRNLAKTNTARRGNYLDYYDETTRRIVSKVYARDIGLLGYTFDNTSITNQRAYRERNNGFLISLANE